MNQESLTSSPSLRHRSVAFTCLFIGIVQTALGGMFLFMPVHTAHLMGFPAIPAWANWLLGMLAARCLGYAIGMFIAASDPYRYRAWIQTMILVQTIDWIVTMIFVGSGQLTLAQVNTAAVFPVLWIATLWWGRAVWTRTEAA